MADNTIILQGKFTSDGTVKVIPLRSDVDWMEVINWTQAATQQSTGVGVKFFWQRGMTADTGIEYKKTNSTDALNMVTLASGGFTLVDSSTPVVGELIDSITAISNAALPVASATDTTGLSDGDVVRIIDVDGAAQLCGLDFTIDTVVANTSFRLPYMAQIVAGTAGGFRKILYDSPFYPRHRYISSISKASSAVVKMTVTHGFTVGQHVKLVVPYEYAMIEADGLEGNITAINTTTNTITLDIDSSTFTTFAFPLTADTPFSPAIVIPIGENNMYPDLSDGATRNISYIGMRLATGIQSPGGDTNDVLYWKAGKAFSVTNE